MNNKMQRYKLKIEYEGTNYCGFQKQPKSDLKSIEGLIEAAIYSIFKERVKIAVSGRTDAGVHALGQVIHFDLETIYDDYKIITGLNYYLKNEGIVILDCKKVSNDFHARFSSKGRSYIYKIINRRPRPALDNLRAWHVPLPLDIELMKEASQYLIGEHDFAAFQHSNCQALHTIKTITQLDIAKKDCENIEIHISANAFLQHMVRNIVGTLSLVGLKKVTADYVKNVLDSKDKNKSGPNAPACGLYFIDAKY
ncbi:MAG: tRNA pseudouridine(38-40) synthase TruA [Rickettsiales bacterium]|nr:tRNA pseudouridine(38-40) synthase TruA [Rickettsiales bacterium]